MKKRVLKFKRSSVKDESLVPKPSKTLKPKKNPLVIVLALSVAILVVLIAFITSTILSNNSKSAQTTKDKPALLLSKAAPYLDSTNIKSVKDLNDLESIVNQIKTIKDYESNPNFMYVLTYFALTTGNPEPATKYLELLKKSYKQDVGYSEVIRSKTQTIDQLTSSVNSLVKRAEQALKNINNTAVGQPKK